MTCRLPLPDESVDVAMAMHVLYRVPDIPAAEPVTTYVASIREPVLAWIGGSMRQAGLAAAAPALPEPAAG